MNAPNHNFPPPPPVPAQPGAYAPPPPAQPAYGYPPAGAPAYAPPAAPPAPPPAYGYASQPPQGFAAPAAPGFSQQTQQQMVAAPSLNGIRVNELNLLPNVNIEGQSRLRMTSYVKGLRDSGPAYTIGFQVVSSNVAQIPQGATFHLLCKISFDPKKQGGDKARKKLIAAAFGQNPNGNCDWDALDAQLQQRDFNAQPLTLDLSQSIAYNRPVLDNTTKQPVPNQWWSNQTWTLAPATA